MATPEKDTIYIDIDDEITGVIDKVKNSDSKVVCLVLPKRATVFQSIVNMKLLKRAADSNKKNVVLITSEAGLLPLAGAAGVHVAKSLTTKPEIPVAPKPVDDNDEPVDEDTPIGGDDIEPDKTVGELAGATAAGAAAGKAFDNKDDVETLTLDNEEPETTGEDEAKEDSKEAKPKKDKSLKVPNFKRFRLAITIGVIVLLLLICGFIFADSSLDKATIDITTSETNVNTNLAITLSTSANSVDAATNTVPAKYVSQQKTSSQQVGTTGQKNEGNEASGTIQMSAQECAPDISQPPDVPSGSGVSSNGLTYITQADTTFSLSGGHGSCVTYEGTSSTQIMAQSGGASYNVSGVPFTVAGRSDVTANGSASGGTDNIVQTVNQNDINNAESKISSSGNTSAVKQALESQLKGDGYYPIPATFSSGTPSYTPSANVGTAASSVTVTETTTYSMFGAYESDLNQLIDNYVDGQIDTSKQTVIDSGLSSANFSINGTLTSTGGQLNMTTKSIAGPNLNVAGIQQEVAGQKEGAIKAELSANPNVTNVKVSFSPFWISSAPKNTNKITVNIDKNSSN